MFRFFENLVDPFAPFPERTPPGRLWPFLWSHLRGYRKLLIVMACTGLVVAFMETGLIFYSGRIFDLMTDAGPDAFWSLHGLEVLVATLFILFLRPILHTLNMALLNQTLAGNLQAEARWRAHKHLLGQSVSFFQNDFAGRLANRVMQIGPAVEDASFMAMEGIWYATAYVLGALMILSGIDWRLALPLAVWVVLYIGFVRRVAPRVGEASERLSRGRSAVTGRVVDAYTNMDTVKLFAHGAREEAYALSAMKRLRLRFLRFMRLMTTMSLGLQLLNGLLIVGVVGPGIWLWHAGTVTVGDVAAASALTLRLNGMTGWIMWVTIRLFEHAGVIRESLDSLKQPHGVVDAPGAPELAVPRGEIRFDAVSHHYGKARGGLDRVSLTIAPGEKIGLVGRSGAGKSTLVNLLMRFHDVEGGRIEIDGQAIDGVTQDSLRRRIGMVTQDSSLLHRSVRENILYGRPGASMEEVIAAAKRAEAHGFITTLRDRQGRSGYDVQVGERGVKLSGGQRQRIALARVILKDAPVLVLDEATSALDSEVEAAIQDTLYRVMQGKTVIAIAHRLSTIAQMDRIVVMDGGHIAEQGSHAELLARGGLYAGFWARQSGGFIGLDPAEGVDAAE
ncbi:ABC transporter ATP-binding protein [Paroceanicella profunda]|uniref:ABC transporter ATP-binding protein n=1 Tax=Paroceanicella profunda TaxID=2579971 RepID=A0A5B8FHM0_9RHOB|nr:ABC transporter ATP-binding protein [Paroceanicella profunda]QDL92317.1 ABC transporter ATP-binding protein [Paroceanicella profunda]